MTPGGERTDPSARRPLTTAMLRGAAGACPACGGAPLFDGYLAVRPTCASCGLAFSEHRADDLPPYLTCLLTGKLAIAALVTAAGAGVDDALLSDAALTALVAAGAVGAAMALIRPIKGAVIGQQWALGMHGFDPNPAFPDPAGPDLSMLERRGRND